MKKFIGAMVFGVIVVIGMVTQWTREQSVEQAPATSFNAPLDAQMQAAESQSSANHVTDDGWSLHTYEVAATDGAFAQEIDVDSIAYVLQHEAVDNQWFREMEQALYSISSSVLEPEGVRMVNLECVTSVCIAAFESDPDTKLSINAFLRASRNIDVLHQKSLSKVFLANHRGQVERIIFQRKE